MKKGSFLPLRGQPGKDVQDGSGRWRKNIEGSISEEQLS